MRNYNGDVLPSDLIGVGTFPVPEVRDCPNDEIIELYAKKAHGFFRGSALVRGLYGNGHDASASEFVESAGKLRVYAPWRIRNHSLGFAITTSCLFVFLLNYSHER